MGQWFRGITRGFKETKEKGGARVIVCFLKRDFFLKKGKGEKRQILINFWHTLNDSFLLSCLVTKRTDVVVRR